MFRQVAATELARVLGVLSHPARLRIVEELRSAEQDVGDLSQALNIAPAGISQHLARLREQHIVEQRREGRHTYYRLRDPELAEWLVSGLRFVLSDTQRAAAIGKAVARAKRFWSSPTDAD